MSPFSMVSSSGAWCWFQDPRAVYLHGLHDRTYWQSIDRAGNLEVGSFDHQTNEVERRVLEPELGRNDHNAGSFLVLPDRRLMAFYSRHNGDEIYCRTSLAAESIEGWSDRRTVADGGRLTYTHPAYLSSPGRYYVLFRGSTWKPSFVSSADGITWTKPQLLLLDPRAAELSVRPYLKARSDGISKIHLAVTDGHPQETAANGVYYAVFQDERLYRADGEPAAESLPAPPQALDCVARAEQGSLWIWDVSLDAWNHPCILYSEILSPEQHRYWYARWRAGAWERLFITEGGRPFPTAAPDMPLREPCYSAGLCFSSSDASVVYLSRQHGHVFRLEQWTHDDQLGWRAEAFETPTAARPICPYAAPSPRSHVLFMAGEYRHYDDFDTSILLLPTTENGARAHQLAEQHGKRCAGRLSTAVLPRLAQALARPDGELLSEAQLIAIRHEWLNEFWSVGAGVLMQLEREVRDAPGVTLELGSGLSTLLLADFARRYGAEVLSLEHDATWAECVRLLLSRFSLSDSCEVRHMPLGSFHNFDWYNTVASPLEGRFDLIFCDGPPSSTRGGRRGMLELLAAHIDGETLLLVDDAQRPEDHTLLEEWACALGRTFTMHGPDPLGRCWALFPRKN